MYRRMLLRWSLCVVRATGTGAVQCTPWHRPRGQSHHVSARGSALFAHVLRQQRAAAGAHRGRRSSAHLLVAARCAPCGPYVRRSVHPLAPSRRGYMARARFRLMARRFSTLLTFEFWTATYAHRGQRTSGSISIGFPQPLHDGLHLRRVCCLRWGECVKGLSTVQSQGPKEGDLNRER